MIVAEWVPRQRFAGALKRCNVSRELPRGYADVLLLECFGGSAHAIGRRHLGPVISGFAIASFTAVRTRAHRVSP